MERTHTTSRQSIILCSLIVLLWLSAGTALGGAGEMPRKGGTLRVGMNMEPPSLDAHGLPPGAGQLFSGPYVEGLYTQGQDYGWIPMLAEGHTVSDDGLVYTIRLRRGVPFHHGQELTAADAVALLRRYGRMNARGRQLFQRVESVQALNRYTIQLRLQGHTALVLPFLGAAIYPREVLEEAGEGQVRTYIGTGPFKLAELQPGRHLKYVRFEQYKSRPEPPNGYGGGKTAWVDTLLLMYLPEDRARLAAIEAGEVDLAYFPTSEAYDRLKAHPDLKVQIFKSELKAVTRLNTQKGLFTNVKLRQAALAALDMEAIMQAAVGHPRFYRLDPSLSSQESPWWTDAGGELYNQRDPEKARRLLHEVGYQGEPMRYMVSDAANHHRLGLATKQQLEAAGFTVELQVMEMQTHMRRRTNPDLWDAYTTDTSDYMVQDPALYNLLRCDAGRGNCEADFVTLFQALEVEPQFERRYRLWQDIHRLFWDRVPLLLYGERFYPLVMRQHVHGGFDMPGWYYWNVWLAQ